MLFFIYTGRISAKDTENKEFLNGIIKYGVPIIGGALVLEAAILGVNVKGNKIPTLKNSSRYVPENLKTFDMFPQTSKTLKNG